MRLDRQETVRGRVDKRPPHLLHWHDEVGDASCQETTHVIAVVKGRPGGMQLC